MALKPLISVVIPTFNREKALYKTLCALEKQAYAPAFEVIVVNDGSTDETRLILDSWKSRIPIRAIHQENKKPAAARNHGTRQAQGEVVLYLGDDTIPRPGLLEAHWRRHKNSKKNPKAVLGYTPYHPDSGPKSLLFFLQEMGHQFGYGLIQNPENLPFNFLYSSNLSMPRAVLGDSPFCEAIQAAAWEDVELGIRLAKQGLPIVFEPTAIADHLHPTDLLQFCRRQEMVGATSLQALLQNPELCSLFGDGKPSQKILRMEKPLKFLARCIHTLLHLGFPVYAPSLFRAILDMHYHKGLKNAWNHR